MSLRSQKIMQRFNKLQQYSFTLKYTCTTFSDKVKVYNIFYAEF